MLAPRTPSAFVCIRCELRLARPSLSSLPRPSSYAAAFSTSSRRRDALDDHAATLADSTPRARPKLTGNPVGRIRKRKGKAALRESTAQLAGVKTLGKDSEILVLEEIGDAPKLKDPPASEIPEPLESEDVRRTRSILASLEAEGVEVGQEEINQQLDSLRPKTHSNPDEPHYITQADFLKLQKSLVEGFSIQQLSRYFSVRKGIQERIVTTEVLHRLKVPGTAKGAVARSQWFLGTSPLGRRLPGSIGLKGPKRKPVGKRSLVDQILRSVWDLVLLEEIEAPGEIEMTLKPWQLALLNSGATTPLDRIGNMRKAKIEIHWAQSVIRITADKSTAEYTADDVESLLQGTELQKLSLKPWIPFLPESVATKNKPTSLFSEDALQTVQKLSGAIVQVTTNDTFSIRALDKNSIQEAQRFLIRMLPLEPSYAHTIEYHRLDRHKDMARLQPSYMKSSLSYRLRSMDIGRWALPVQKSNGSESGNQEGEPSKNHLNGAAADAELYSRTIAVLKKPLQIISGQPKSIKTKNGATWMPQAHENLSATFGQALFSMDHTGTTAADVPLTTFETTVPGLSKILLDNNIRPEAALPVQLLYTFTPSPHQGNKLDRLEDYPELTIRFMQTNGQPRLRDVTLSFKEQCHDVLLPDLATDIRLRKGFKLGLSGALKEPNIKAFADAVKDNIKSGARLTAPPSLTIEVPKWTIPGYKRDNIGTRTIEYLFTEVTHRQNFNVTLDDQPLSLGITQKGKLGGNSTRFSIHYSDKSERRKPSLVNNWGELDKFVKLSFSLADRITEAAANTLSLSAAAAHLLPPASRVTQAASGAPKARVLDSARRLKRRSEAEKREKEEMSGVDMVKMLAAQELPPDSVGRVAPQTKAEEAVFLDVESPESKESRPPSATIPFDWPTQPAGVLEGSEQAGTLNAAKEDDKQITSDAFTDTSTRLTHDDLDDPRLMDLLHDDGDAEEHAIKPTEAQKTLVSST